MRCIFSYIFICHTLLLCAQHSGNTQHDYGKVKDWNNPVFETSYTNTSRQKQVFLPIYYTPDVRVNIAKLSLSPGESTTIKIQYYTQDFGRFSSDIPLYISTEARPLIFTVKGNIQSFHPNAFTICPSIENSDLGASSTFDHTIAVIDAVTGKEVNDFEIKIQTNTTQERIMSDKSILILKRENPSLYTISVQKEGFESQTIEKYINRNTEQTTIALQPKEKLASAPDVPVLKEEIEQLITENDETVPIKGIEPKDVIKPKEVVASVPADTNDYVASGTLNSTKYAFNNIVFLIDVSTSMRNEDKLPLLKQSMHQMIGVLRPEDKVSIITYASTVSILAQDLSGDRKDDLATLVDALEAKGQSYGQEGLDMAFDLAKDLHIADGNNEIILASDGVFNSSNFKEERVYRRALFHHKVNKIRLSTIGFGTSPTALVFLETLASKGDGSFIVISTADQAASVLIQNIMKHSTKALSY